ncbi:MAG TPA: squalene synthase HpnC [Candidatus Binataceae bacterium]|nr:squalene synthase HpnC [Candidatus Binataceae bacterium]
MSAVPVNARAESAIAAASDNNLSQSQSPVSLEQAYEFCARLAKSHYENFTIASWLMPREMRPSMHAIYAYARMADDFADEEHDLAKLDQWERELDLCYAGTPRHPVFVALADTVRRYNIPKEPFADLLVAFRSDVNFAGFETLDEILATYTRYSANPVGRLVLYLFGYRDEERQRLSDLVCSGLQLANFWQDVAIDLDKGRIYFPRADLRKFSVTPADLEHRVASPQFLALMRHEVEVARTMLRRGAELQRMVNRRLSRDLLMFAGGGLAILNAIERVGFDVFSRRPKLKKFDYLKLGFNALTGRSPS